MRVLCLCNTPFYLKIHYNPGRNKFVFQFVYNPYCYDADAVNRLKELGYEVTELSGRCYQYPELPEEPQASDYETEDTFREAKLEYDQEVNDYMEECKELVRRNEEGEISLYAQIGQKDISMCYVEVATQSSVSAQTAGQEQLSPIQKLDKQDKRNKEIAREKTIEDTKRRIFEVDVTEAKFGAEEDKMIYFFLLSSLRKEHFATAGIENEDIRYLSDENKLNIIANLTPKAKYEKRHQRIEEKKAVLQVQEQGKQETEHSESDTTEQQPQSQEAAA